MAFVLFDNISFSFTQKFWETGSVISTKYDGKQWRVYVPKDTHYARNTVVAVVLVIQ